MESYTGICDICGGEPVTGYYDITVTGIGDFWFYCANPVCQEKVIAKGRALDERRAREYAERQEWNNNYRGVPVEEV